MARSNDRAEQSNLREEPELIEKLVGVKYAEEHIVRKEGKKK